MNNTATKTDWKRLETLSDDEIDTSDIPELDEEFFKNAKFRDEYKREELGKGVRGKYYQAYQESHNLVLLEPEIAKAFPTDEAVNNALRFLLSIVETSSHLIAPPKQMAHTD